VRRNDSVSRYHGTTSHHAPCAHSHIGSQHTAIADRASFLQGHIRDRDACS
jgi:hypothetical protein